MLSEFGFENIYIACGYTDLRYGIDGLAATVKEKFSLNPFSPRTLFMFCGRRNDRIKTLVWEGDGFLLLYKRLEAGSFKWPRKEDDLRGLTYEQKDTAAGAYALSMEKEKFTRQQLNNLDKDMLITLLLSMQDQLMQQTAAIEKLTEQIALMNTRAFAKKSEKLLTDDSQLNFFVEIFNEAESLAAGQTAMEPGIDMVIVLAHKRRKRKGKLDEDLSDFPVKVIEHTMTEKELNDCFPEGYGRLPDEVYRKLELIPAVFEVHEHHIAVYRGKNGKIVRAERPKEMLDASIATPSLVSAIINGKYTNAVPLYRQEQEFGRNDVNISRQTMSNWVITVAERYISLVYDRLKEEIIKS